MRKHENQKLHGFVWNKTLEQILISNSFRQGTRLRGVFDIRERSCNEV